MDSALPTRKRNTAYKLIAFFSFCFISGVLFALTSIAIVDAMVYEVESRSEVICVP